jgi:predicted nuclease of predicted toxin-antitoxin system
MTVEETEVDLGLESVFTDAVAARADAFGVLAIRMEEVTDEKVRELCMQMLRKLIRSIKTPPGAELHEFPGGKA